ncbi:MAG: MFS transporter [Pirellulales bacterium]|nr:MFS transporter [Pirellulales bacterium]
MSEEKSLTTGQWLVLVAAFLGWMFDGVEMGLFPLIARPALQELLGVTGDALVGQWNGYLIAAFMLGAASGGLVFGWIGDKIGRVRGMALSILVYSIFTGLCYFVTAPWQLFVLRFIAALGMGGQWALAVALIMECWPDKFRPILAGVIGGAANFGFLLIAVVAWYFPVTSETWRIMMLAGAVPGVLALLIIMFVPESQRWKASVDHRHTSPLREVFRPPLLRKTLLGIVFSSVPLIATWGAVSGWTPLWIEQTRQMELAQPHLTTEQQQQTQAATTVDDRVELIFGYTNEEKEAVPGFLTAEQCKNVANEAAPAKAWVQIMLSIGAIIGCLFGSSLGHRLGRRPAYFLLCVFSFGLCAFLYQGSGAFSLQFLAIMGLVGVVSAAFYGWAPLYLPELFPTRVRATGQGISFNFGRILTAVGSIVTGHLLIAYGGDYAKACSIIILVYFVGMVVIWFGPETKGKPLPE